MEIEEEDCLRTEALRKLCGLNPVAMYNAVEETDEISEDMLVQYIDEPYLRIFVSNISVAALRAFVQGRVESSEHLLEISKMFDFAGVQDQVGSLLRILIPGNGYHPSIDENVRLPSGVGSGTRAMKRTDTVRQSWLLEAFVQRKARNWIDWLLEIEPILQKQLIRYAAKHGDLSLMSEHIKKQQEATQEIKIKDTMLSVLATENGHICILDYLSEEKAHFDQNLAFWAATNGQHKVLDWLLEHRLATFTYDLLDAAASRGFFHFVQYYHSQGVHLKASTRAKAKEHGYLDLLLDPPPPSDFIRIYTKLPPPFISSDTYHLDFSPALLTTRLSSSTTR